MKTRLASYLGTAFAVALLSPSAFAVLSISNGDFESGIVDEANQTNVSGWFDVTTGQFFENTWQSSVNGIVSTDLESGFSGQANTVFSAFVPTPEGDVNVGSWLYQSIGTANGATTLDLTFQWGNPQDAPAGRDLGITVGVYAWDGIGAFVAGDDVDVLNAAGVTLLDSVSFSALGEPGGPTLHDALASLDLTGAGSQELFLRFNNFEPGTGDTAWVALDNVAIVPEPSAALLSGLGVLALLRRRR
jgi:hypothetical protein